MHAAVQSSNPDSKTEKDESVMDLEADMAKNLAPSEETTVAA